ncbi:MAG: hypothetical protein RR549_04725 [Oscillospiraceae bacterium]
MVEFWNSLNLPQQIYACIAVPASLIMIIQTILLFFGFGDHDMDVDTSSDMHEISAGDGFTLFTIRGIIAFFTVSGWVGFCLSSTQLNLFLIIIISLIAGFIALVIIGLMFKYAMKLQEDGTVSFSNAIGKTATVYITIPKNRENCGKVNVIIQERLIEAEAVTDFSKKIPTGSGVKVVDVTDDNTLVVSPL